MKKLKPLILFSLLTFNLSVLSSPVLGPKNKEQTIKKICSNEKLKSSYIGLTMAEFEKKLGKPDASSASEGGSYYTYGKKSTLVLGVPSVRKKGEFRVDRVNCSLQ